MAKARWLEISLVVNDELAEAVADVLGRFVSQGVVMERSVEFNDAEDEGTPYGPVRVSGYLPVDEQLEDVRQQLEQALWYLGRIQPLPEPSYRTIEDQDWMAAWKQHYRPIPVGQKLMILPAWLSLDTEDRIAVRIDPSMAFGTGTHPTTQLCMALLENRVSENEPVIDVGCGSGILSIAAVKLGAVRALAVDIDPLSVKATLENAQANGVSEKIEAGLGSVAEILQKNFSLDRAPLVLANILAPVIVRLLDAGLAQLVLPGGILILSGIMVDQADSVIEAAARHQLTLIEQQTMGDWIALVMQAK
ncbi:MAG TPA: 50S ribosomal protein L11 methyltransferase [Anaerolineaceae bacterium]|nr:50S ribosomal protein L11 methyltransferase [Anaerolineaceae bacterium]HNS37073.1 50S ribosomal protein L11 methyltransferase [Anaerolineaceae bacterium]